MRRSIPILFALLTMTSSMAMAQQLPDKKAVFNYQKGSSAFIFPGGHNEASFKEVCIYIDAHRKLIDNGSMPIYVYGYCGTNGTQTERAQRVGKMSNYLKGEFIHARKAEEHNFITRNSTKPYSTEMPNVVVLQFVLPQQVTAKEVKSMQETAPQVEVNPQVVDSLKVEPKVVEEKSKPEVAVAEIPTATPAELCVQTPSRSTNPYQLAISTNLLSWGTLSPNLGVQLMWNQRYAATIDGSYGDWVLPKYGKNILRLSGVGAEGRRYFRGDGSFAGFYVGAGARWMKFNCKNSYIGRDGDMVLAGINGGYTWRFCSNWTLEGAVGAGYVHQNYDRYTGYAPVSEYILLGHRTRNCFGLTNASISISYRFKL